MADLIDRPLVSYAQNREDLFLWGLLAHRTPGTYVDVGCYQERLHSVTRLFYEHGWCGLNIDANPEFEAQYRVRERDTFVWSGIGSTAGELVFRSFPRHDGLSTFDPGLQVAHAAAGYPYADVRVPVRTLDDVLQQEAVRHVDFLKVDVEGFEHEVLAGLDFNSTRPTVVVTEATRSAECASILTANRYHHEFFDGLNHYYVDDDADDVTIYNYTPRVLEAGYVTDRERVLAEKLASAQPIAHRVERVVSRWGAGWRRARDRMVAVARRG